MLLLPLAVGYFNKAYAGALVWTMIQGETGIGLWLILEVPVFTAICIAIACDCMHIYLWFWITDKSLPVLTRFWPSKRDEEEVSELEEKWYFPYIKKIPYYAMPLFGFVPYLLWLGPASSKALKLNRILCIVLMVAGSALKMYLVALGLQELIQLAK